MIKHLTLAALLLLLPLPAFADSQQDADKIAILTADRDAYIKTVDQFRVQLIGDEREIAQLKAKIVALEKERPPMPAPGAHPAPATATPKPVPAHPASPAPTSPTQPARPKP